MGLKTVGRPEKVNLAILQRLDGRPPGCEALDPDRQTGNGAEDAGVIGSKTFIVLATECQVEGWIIRCRCTQDQLTLVLEPLPLCGIEADIQLPGRGATQQGEVFTARCREQ
ncbi:hypothetical protein D3C84_433250 [compost metagenome]